MTRIVLPLGSVCVCGQELHEKTPRIHVCDACGRSYRVENGCIVTELAEVVRPVEANWMPECGKMAKSAPISQPIGEFLDWLLNEKGYILARWEKNLDPDADPDEDLLMPKNPGIQNLLAEYFQIDLKLVEQERRAMMEALRQQHEKGESAP